MSNVISSVSYDQTYIISSILKLYNKDLPIDFDPCFNFGGFYKNGIVQRPEIVSDIKPLLPGVEKYDVRALPFENCFRCCIFDPPFIVNGKNSKMGDLYGFFNSVDEMRVFWKDALLSLFKALKNRGLLIVKCQDFVSGRKNYIFSNEILNMAKDIGFSIIDCFILLAKTRPIRMKKQCHARKYHSYFFVFKKAAAR